jgi:heme o synthase
VLAWQLRGGSKGSRQAAHRLFAFSIVYLFVLFAALLASNISNRWSSVLSARIALIESRSVQARSASRGLRITRSAAGVSSDEV